MLQFMVQGLAKKEGGEKGKKMGQLIGFSKQEGRGGFNLRIGPEKDLKSAQRNVA